MSGLIADSRTMIDRARVEAQVLYILFTCVLLIKMSGICNFYILNYEIKLINSSCTSKLKVYVQNFWSNVKIHSE